MKAKDRILNLLTACGPTGCVSSAIAEICGLWSGTMYVALVGLEKRGLIESEFDPGEYPRRRRYWRAGLKPTA